MMFFKNKYNQFFCGFLLSIVIVFFLTRPLNSQWHKFIDGDGLGYYSYLPAKYIYNDASYEFKWFNDVHKANYDFCSFKTPVDNFLTPYKGKFINKYYQGLSYLWLPFFGLGHVVAKLTNYPVDGYSLPYQLSIGLASLFYLFIGLYFLRKLIFKLYKTETVALIVTAAMFYGTPLFYYSLQLNSQSHVYSFTFITLFLYATVCFFNNTNYKLKWFLLAALFFVIIICIRPLNGLILFVTPAFIPKYFKFKKSDFEKPSIIHFTIICFLVGALYNQLQILYTQTHSFIPYTYTNERFYFSNPHFVQAFFSYNMGLFVYVPLALLSSLGILYLPTIKQKILFPSLLILVVYIYSSWWYWPITSRTLIDFYPLFSILLGALLLRFINNTVVKTLLIGLVLLSTMFYQLKNYQVHNGVLDEFYTHKELFWRNFLRIKPSNIYCIPPTSIITKKEFVEDFETQNYKGATSEYRQKSGKKAALLSADNEFSSLFNYDLPLFMKGEGIKKIRFSFWCWFGKNMQSTQIYFKLYNSNDSLVQEIPFYLSKNKILHEKWDYKEFGTEINIKSTIGELSEIEKTAKISVFIWNDKKANEVYFDDIKTEFILTNEEFENIK